MRAKTETEEGEAGGGGSGVPSSIIDIDIPTEQEEEEEEEEGSPAAAAAASAASAGASAKGFSAAAAAAAAAVSSAGASGGASAEGFPAAAAAAASGGASAAGCGGEIRAKQEQVERPARPVVKGPYWCRGARIPTGGLREGDRLRVVFAAGGTGGHVYPAIAIADEILKAEPSAMVVFVGTRERMEWKLVPASGYPIRPIPAVGIRRPFLSLSNLLLPFRLLYSLWRCWKLLASIDPHVVIGTGGYVAGPTCLIAAMRGIPVVVQEQNAFAGITNRILAWLAATVVYVAFPEALKQLPKDKCVVAGNPTRSRLRHVSREEARELLIQFNGNDEKDQGGGGGGVGAGVGALRLGKPLGLMDGGKRLGIDVDVNKITATSDDYKDDGQDKNGDDDDDDDLEKFSVVCVFGGSLGARKINMVMEEMAAGLLEENPKLFVLWQTGSAEYRSIVRRIKPHPRLALLPFVECMDLVYAAADVVVGRAGAITCSELLVTGTPSILIPSPNVAEDHQMKNARAMVDAGAAELLLDEDVTATSLAQLIRYLLADKTKLLTMRQNAEKAASPDAAKEIASAALEFARSKKQEWDVNWRATAKERS